MSKKTSCPRISGRLHKLALEGCVPLGAERVELLNTLSFAALMAKHTKEKTIRPTVLASRELTALLKKHSDELSQTAHSI